jgi:TorA maturation chaperone TorD
MTATTTDPAVARGIAYALLARLLGADTRHIADPETWTALEQMLEWSGDERALRRLRATPRDGRLDEDELARRWVRWFDLGRVAPYECSNTPPTAGGHTARLADIAGFYRAFGMDVPGDRPDHAVAELEFASIVTLAEAEARANGDRDGEQACAQAARSFLRDHLGGWLDAWAARIGGIDVLAPWAPVAAAAADLVAGDAARRGVVPVRKYAVLPGDASLLPDDASDLPVCGSGIDG